MNLATNILRALAYSADLARPLAREAVDVAIDRGLSLLTGVLPTRTITTNAGDPYLGRTYLAGRLPKGFPANLHTRLGSLDGAAYVHRFHRGDLEPEHHSHPWEWAVSVILAGSYVEEVVLADGSIVTRERRPGSVGVLTAGSFHRVAELQSPHVWTLFLTGPRTPDGAWYFRRLNGEIVPHDVFIAEREAERAAALRASKPTVVETGPGGWWGDGFTMDATPGDRRENAVEPLADMRVEEIFRASQASFEDACRTKDSNAAAEETSAGPPAAQVLVEHFPSLDVEKRLTFEDGSVAELLVDDLVPKHGVFTISRNWRATEGENMAAAWVRLDRERFEKAAKPATIDHHALSGRPGCPKRGKQPQDFPVNGGPCCNPRCGGRWGTNCYHCHDLSLSVPADPEPIDHHELCDCLDCRFGEEQPGTPEGYTFERRGGGIIVRLGESYVGSLLAGGEPVQNGREIKPAELDQHADAWAHARAMRGAS